jgi:hypothetical protein
MLSLRWKQFSSLLGPNPESLADSLKIKNLIGISIPHMAGDVLKSHL